MAPISSLRVSLSPANQQAGVAAVAAAAAATAAAAEAAPQAALEAVKSNTIEAQKGRNCVDDPRAFLGNGNRLLFQCYARELSTLFERP